MLTAFVGGPIFDGERCHQGCALIARDGRVADIVAETDFPSDARTVRLDGRLAAPGFVDLQVNGGGGVLFNDHPDVETIRTIIGTHRRFGTTALLPTLITDTPEATDRAIAAVRQALSLPVAGCLGLHLEGPFLAPTRKGAHDAARIRPLDEDDVRRLAASEVSPLLLTLAPEIVPAPQIARLAAAGAVISLGHSDASFETAMDAARAGARGVTHLFNAMSSLSHRAPGLVGAALASPLLWCGLIADGHHVHPAAIALALRAKVGPARVFLVSDAMACAGCEGGSFSLQGRTVTRADGRLTLDDGTLAGSDLTMDAAVRFMIEQVGVDRDEALRMAALYPARFLGIDAHRGRLAPGSRADIVILDDRLYVHEVYVAGMSAADEFARR